MLYGLELLYRPDIVTELRFFFPQPGYSSPESHISFPGLDDQESPNEDEKRTGAEVENTRHELDDQETDRGKCEACLHIGMHGSLSRKKGLFLSKQEFYIFNSFHVKLSRNTGVYEKELNSSTGRIDQPLNEGYH